MNRRIFLCWLLGVSAARILEPIHYAPTPSESHSPLMDQINAVTLEHIRSQMSDNFFQQSPLLELLRMTPAERREYRKSRIRERINGKWPDPARLPL